MQEATTVREATTMREATAMREAISPIRNPFYFYNFFFKQIL